MKNFRLPSIAPQYALIFGIVWLSLICLLIITTEASESGAEAYLRFVTLFSFWMNTALFTLFAAAVLSAVIYNFGKGIQITHTWTYEKTGPALPDGLNILPDMAVFSQSPEESGESLQERWEKACSMATNIKWAVFIPFRQPTGVIHKIMGISFTRDTPPYQGEDWPKISEPGFNYMNETWEEYQAYIQSFCTHFPQWAATTKVLQAGPNVASVAGNILNLGCMLLMFALPVSLSAQKSEQVREYLGDVRYNSAPDKGQVKFVFKKVVLSRNSDGVKTYKQLLPDADFYTDEQNAGSLLAVQVFDGKVLQAIQPEPKRTEHSAKSASAAVETESAKPVPSVYTLRDSATIAADVDHSKAMVDRWKQEIWREIKPYWGLVTYIISAFSVPIMLLGGILWYICSTAAMESAINLYGVPVVGKWIYSVHQGSAAMLLIIVWVEVVCILVNSFMWMVYTEKNLWVMFILWAIMLWIAKKITNRLVPNVQVVGGGQGRVVGGGYRALN